MRLPIKIYLKSYFLCARSIVFTFYSHFRNCSGSLDNNGFNGDDMEVYIRFLSNPSEWIPLAMIQIYLQRVNPMRHGYNIPYIYILESFDMPIIHANITICNFSLTDSIQVRWLVTSRSLFKDRPARDVWSLDDVAISLTTECDNYKLLADSFDMNELK